MVDVRLAKNDDGSLKGFGHVEFANEAAAMKALEKNGEELLGRSVKLDPSRPRGERFTPSGNQDGNYSSRPRQTSGGPTAFVKGFDRTQEEDSIRNNLSESFKSCGEIVNIRIPMDRESGESKGFAYIQFKDQDALSKALELGGNGLYVDEAMERSGGGDGGRGGGRFSGGRGGGRFSGGRGGGRFSGGRDRGGGRGRGGRSGGRGGPKFDISSSGTGKKTKFGDD